MRMSLGEARETEKGIFSTERNRFKESVPYVPYLNCISYGPSIFPPLNLSMRWLLTTLEPGELAQCDAGTGGNQSSSL